MTDKPTTEELAQRLSESWHAGKVKQGDLDAAAARLRELEAALSLAQADTVAFSERVQKQAAKIAELEAELSHAMEQWRLFREDNEGLRKARDDLQRRIDSAPPCEQVEGTQSDGQPVSVPVVDCDEYERWYFEQGPGRDA